MIDVIVNILAILCSGLAMFQLSFIAALMKDKTMKNVFIYLVLGIFFAVFVHATVELLAVFDVLNEHTLMLVMGGLIIIGSVFFIMASIESNKVFNTNTQI
ncbi:hypothetical protein TI03_01010 [Achromatium sp. WMS1]|nr:hypothetical protein TI03_01010 [Achromatium sp. WMS1]